MKSKWKNVLIIVVLTLILCNWSYSYWATKLNNEVKITTDNYYVGEVEYENFNIKAKMIREVETNQIGYCLEIDKSYPKGETFKENGYATKQLAGILASGYPSKSYSELKLYSEEEAYFATQIAVWSFVEGYDVNGFKGDTRVVEAIKKIYNEGIRKDEQSYSNEYMLYYSNDNIQDIALIKNEQSKLREENMRNAERKNIEGSSIYGK
ncbi:thioester domain-containing protein [Clostridium sp. 1001275B_160808_H3]|uniref:thioester domain-containing protein n=1 Tax=Clostridium sp. 1001275B_160808_H3 TaxID=2787110 RepID=UPI00189A9018|nr:thioester domain-containing protein [Clostridium sp. 1001275B_160808_H3]